jgi:hypothetical protein
MGKVSIIVAKKRIIARIIAKPVTKVVSGVVNSVPMGDLWVRRYLGILIINKHEASRRI